MLPILPDNVINKIMMFMSSPTAKVIDLAVVTQVEHIVKNPKFDYFKEMGRIIGNLGLQLRDIIMPGGQGKDASRNQRLAIVLGYKMYVRDTHEEHEAAMRAEPNYGDIDYLKHLKDEFQKSDDIMMNIIYCKNI